MAMVKFGEGAVVRNRSAEMLFIVGQVFAIARQKHIESRNSREYSEQENESGKTYRVL